MKFDYDRLDRANRGGVRGTFARPAVLAGADQPTAPAVRGDQRGGASAPTCCWKPELASEGTAEITLAATDAFGLEATLRFQVQVAFHWSNGPTRGWRATLHGTEDGAKDGL